MKARSIIFASLTTAIVSGLGHLQADAQPSDAWVEESLGVYQSQIWSGGGVLSGTTEFQATEDGAVAGSYTMNEFGTVVPGTLSECEAIQPRVMRCIWNDEYGTGIFEATFSEDFSSFDGYWGADNSKPEFLWRGSR
jgi:hypothetical protein